MKSNPEWLEQSKAFELFRFLNSFTQRSLRTDAQNFPETPQYFLQDKNTTHCTSKGLPCKQLFIHHAHLDEDSKSPNLSGYNTMLNLDQRMLKNWAKKVLKKLPKPKMESPRAKPLSYSH